MRSVPAASSAAAPLCAAGELLARYGTDEQKGYFLPRLADGANLALRDE